MLSAGRGGLISLVLTGTLLLLPGLVAAAREEADETTLYVTLGESDQLALVDPWNFKVKRTIKIDPRPHGLNASPDGEKIYLTSEVTGNLQVIDAAKGEILGNIHVGHDPNQLAVTPDGKLAFVPLRGEAAVAVVELEPELKLVRRLSVPEMPHNIYTSADGRRAYVGCIRGSAIVVIDTAAREVAATIQMPGGVRPMALKRDGSLIYVALSRLHGFAVFDPLARRIINQVELPRLPEGTPRPFLDTYTHGLALSADEKELWVTSCAGDAIYAFSLPDYRQKARIHVGHFPHWFALRPDGKVLFLSNWLSDAVSAIDVVGKKVLANVEFARGTGPKRILVASRRRSKRSQESE